jgi:hypothetical protein
MLLMAAVDGGRGGEHLRWGGLALLGALTGIAAWRTPDDRARVEVLADMGAVIVLVALMPLHGWDMARHASSGPGSPFQTPLLVLTAWLGMRLLGRLTGPSGDGPGAEGRIRSALNTLGSVVMLLTMASMFCMPMQG